MLNELIAGMNNIAVCGPDDLEVLWKMGQDTNHLPGSVAEVGVFRGGTLKILAKACPEKIVYGFDTFNGMPPTDPKIDHHKEGDFGGVSLEQVVTFLVDCPNVILRKGFFPDTAQAFNDERFSTVFLDCDIYQSVKDGCEFFWPRMVKGGMLYIHDYGYPGCPGATKAVDEYFKDTPKVPTGLNHSAMYVKE